ncbi:MAG: hypothetical protein KatS3mg126_1134 [Lysobacteraceae bacterium]|nr:MAG: hypothetical protein KatS3mg126_1134 [Xanthomonadaceae bacterium]
MRPLRLRRLALCALLAATTPLLPTAMPARAAGPAPIDFRVETVAEVSMRIPRGWARQQDEYSLILTADPDTADSPVLALFAVAVRPGTTVEPSRLADRILLNLDLPAQGIRARKLEERRQDATLFRLHQLEDAKGIGYLASFSYTDPVRGALVHMLFSARQDRFVELGGPLLPLVVFAGLAPQHLDRAREAHGSLASSAWQGCDLARPAQCPWARELGDAATPYVDACGRAWRDAPSEAQKAVAEADCRRSIAIASEVSRMTHETTMKILYNADRGWCYGGEPDCP